MTYAKLTEQNQIQFPTPADYTDGSLTNPSDWKEYVASPRPSEDTVMHKYTERFELISDNFGGEYKIVQCWDISIIEPVGRVAKLQGNTLLFPQRNETLIDGTVVCGFNNLPNSQKIAYGWYLVRDTELPNDGKTYRETGVLVEDSDYGQVIKVVWEEVQPVSEPAFDISKLKLKRAMVQLGKWDAFLQVLSSNPSALEDFNLAVTLTSDDPLVQQMTGVCVQMFGFTLEQVQSMLKECKSDIS
jgi:hypothetical protein